MNEEALSRLKILWQIKYPDKEQPVKYINCHHICSTSCLLKLANS